jgi:hypothetical protein
LRGEESIRETTLHWGVPLAIVLTIAGVTYHNSCSKGDNLQASAVEQPQNPLHDTVGNPVEYTGGNVHESQEDKWENKNTPQNQVSPPFQGVKHSNDHSTPAQDTVGGTAGDTVESTGGNLPKPQEDNWGKKNTPEIPLSASLQGVGKSNDHITPIKSTLKTPVGSTVGEAVGKHIFTQ